MSQNNEQTNDPIIIHVRDLVNQFGTQRVHDGLNLDVRRGEILGVVGGSGTGKSVLLRSIIGLLNFRSGTVKVFGHNIRDDGANEIVNKRIGVLFQDGALFSSLSVLENVEVPLREHAPEIPPKLRRQLALTRIVMCGLPADAAHKLPSQLSGGMRKRAGLARALAMDPEILFLDEPTAGLDPIGAAAFDQLTRTLADALNLTVFLVTHDLDTLYTICDRVAALAEKKVLAIGTLDKVAASDHPWVNEYFHGPRARAALDAKQRHTASLQNG